MHGYHVAAVKFEIDKDALNGSRDDSVADDRGLLNAILHVRHEVATDAVDAPLNYCRKLSKRQCRAACVRHNEFNDFKTKA